MKKKALFIDRDGTLINEPPITFQVDNLEQLELLPGLIRNLYKIATRMDFELVMVTNQDGLGTTANPAENFEIVQNKLLDILGNEGITFDAIFIDDSYGWQNKPTRKPGTAMLSGYIAGEYDLSSSYVIGDRLTDVQLAENLGAKAILIHRDPESIIKQAADKTFNAKTWDEIYTILSNSIRAVTIERVTHETNIKLTINPDGNGKCNIDTGIAFFDHMLEQISKHGHVDIDLKVQGDLQVDEHHTIEDTALALGTAFRQSLADKRGMERYGYCLPMDDCLAQVAIDFGGRSWLVWDATFKRELIGKMPTEMFFHFFKSFSDAAGCNLNIKAEGSNEHHKIESIFKAFARSIKMAVRRDDADFSLPSTKGVL